MLQLLSSVAVDGDGAFSAFRPYGAKSGLIPCILEAQGTFTSGVSVGIKIKTENGVAVAGLYTLEAAGLTPIFYLKPGWQVAGTVTGIGSASGNDLDLFIHG